MTLPKRLPVFPVDYTDEALIVYILKQDEEITGLRQYLSLLAHWPPRSANYWQSLLRQYRRDDLIDYIVAQGHEILGLRRNLLDLGHGPRALDHCDSDKQFVRWWWSIQSDACGNSRKSRPAGHAATGCA